MKGSAEKKLVKVEFRDKIVSALSATSWMVQVCPRDTGGLIRRVKVGEQVTEVSTTKVIYLTHTLSKSEQYQNDLSSVHSTRGIFLLYLLHLASHHV